jgi:hypothetical protein
LESSVVPDQIPRKAHSGLRRSLVPLRLFEKRHSLNGGNDVVSSRGTIPGQLVALSDTLREYVQYGGQSNLQIVRKIEEGLTRLQTATSEPAE